MHMSYRFKVLSRYVMGVQSEVDVMNTSECQLLVSHTRALLLHVMCECVCPLKLTGEFLLGPYCVQYQESHAVLDHQCQDYILGTQQTH